MVPELLVSNFRRSLDFYVQQIGFSVMFERTEPNFAYLDLNGAQLMLEEDHECSWQVGKLESPRGPVINLQIDVPDLKVVEVRLESSAVLLFRPLHESWYETSEGRVGQLELLVQDPDGYLIRLVSDIVYN